MDAEIYELRRGILLRVGAFQTPVSADCQLIWLLYGRFCWRIWSFLHFNPIAHKKSRINHWRDHTDTQRTQIKSHHATLKTNSIAEPASGPSLLKLTHFCRSYGMFSSRSPRVSLPETRRQAPEQDTQMRSRGLISHKMIGPLPDPFDGFALTLTHSQTRKCLDSFGCFFKVFSSPLFSVAHSGFPHLLTKELLWSFHMIYVVI